MSSSIFGVCYLCHDVINITFVNNGDSQDDRAGEDVHDGDDDSSPNIVQADQAHSTNWNLEFRFM